MKEPADGSQLVSESALEAFLTAALGAHDAVRLDVSANDASAVRRLSRDKDGNGAESLESVANNFGVG